MEVNHHPDAEAAREKALKACQDHANDVGEVHGAYQAYAQPILSAEARKRDLTRRFLGALVFAAFGHALIQSESQVAVRRYLPLEAPYSHGLVTLVLLGLYWLTCVQAAFHVPHDGSRPADENLPWWRNAANLPGAIYGFALIAIVILGAVSLDNSALGIVISALGLGIGCVAWVRGLTLQRGITALEAQIQTLKRGFDLEGKLAAVANKYWNFYRVHPTVQASIKRDLERSLPLNVVVWIGKVALAIMVAYPGHIAMGELLGYSANYGLGFKAYFTTWPIVSVLLLVAEILIITGAVEFRLADDAYTYLVRGYNHNHYGRYHFRKVEDSKSKLRWARTCFGIATILALVDLGFNVYYMWDATGNLQLSVMAGAVFTSLLIGLAMLLGNTHDYHHQQHKDTLMSPPLSSTTGPLVVTAVPVAQQTVPQANLLPDRPPVPGVGSGPRLVPLNGDPSIVLDSTRASITVGRAQDNFARINHPAVAERQAMLAWDGQAWTIKDLGSGVVTKVNGVRIQPHQAVSLGADSKIKFGPQGGYEFRLELA